jgi:YVTN family beta-propeller protein
MLRRVAFVGVPYLVLASCNSPTAIDQVRSLVVSWPHCERPPVGAAPTGRGHPALTGHTAVPLAGAPFAVAVSANGVVYVTDAYTGSAVRADLPSTTLSAPFAVGDLPSQVRIDPNGRTAYVSNQDASTVTVVDVATNQAVAAVPVPAGSILTLGLSPEGDRLYALTDYFGVYVINTATREVIDSIPRSAAGSLLTGVAFHPFAPCMYIAARDEGTIRTVDLRDDSVVHSDTVRGARIQNVAVSLDGGQLFATDIQRSKLLVRDLTTQGSSFLAYAIGSGQIRNAFDVAVTPDNTQVYVSTLADGKVYVLDRATRAVLDSIVTGGSARYIGFDRTGTHAVIANEMGWVDFVYADPYAATPVCLRPSLGMAPGGLGHPARAAVDSVALAGTPFAVAVSPSGVLYVTQAYMASAVRADLPSTTFSAPFPVGDLPSQLRMSPDGRTAYVSNQDAGTITFINVATNQAFGTATVPEGSILTTGLSPDGSRLYALTDYYGVYVIDTGTGQVVAQIPTAGMLLTGVAFHPFAPCMYVAARDEGTIRTVDLRNNKIVHTDVVTGARIQNVAVSRDGSILFATDIERSKLLARDLPSGSATFLEYAVGSGQVRNAFDVAVTPDNAQVYVSTLADGKVYVFDRTTRALRDSVRTGGNARYIGFSASGSHAIVANEMGWVTFIH